MSCLIIPDQHIPKSCYSCPCNHNHNWCSILHQATTETVGQDIRLKFCPLIEVDEPLISKTALLDSDADIHQDYVDSDGYCWDSTWGFSREHVEQFPEIISAEMEITS